MVLFLLGASAAAAAAAGLLFLRLWRNTADRFFLLFALSFFLQAASRMLSAFQLNPVDEADMVWERLVAYLMILAAIVQKNRSARVTG